MAKVTLYPGEAPDSKLTVELAAAIREQLNARTRVKAWRVVAELHGISLRNLHAHIRKMRFGSRR